jgi:predicted nuclease of restriction endonuclease-like (RecB) superfamily
MAIQNSENYRSLLVEVKHRIRSAQYEALKAVNRELMTLYWDIGKAIVTRQEVAGWGKSVVEQLAQDLQAEFFGIGGFSARNIWNMRNFYVTYHTNEKLQPLVAEIGWTHNLVILEMRRSGLLSVSLRIERLWSMHCDSQIRRSVWQLIKLCSRYPWSCRVNYPHQNR